MSYINMSENTQTPPCPSVEKALIDHLQSCLRTEMEVSSSKEPTMFEVGVKAGIRRTLEYLSKVFREQSEKSPIENVFQQAKDT